MKIIEPSFEIINPKPEELRERTYWVLEAAGRTCYQSEADITEESAAEFIQKRVWEGHESILEHAVMTVRFIVDRGVSHELVRHRLCAFSQESTRYCNYSKGKFGNELTFIRPFYLDKAGKEYVKWEVSCQVAENTYLDMLANGCKPEEARAVLPNSLKTEVMMTANMREWRHILKLRAAGYAGKPHPQMKQVMVPLLRYLQESMPEIFGGIQIKGETV